MACEFALSAVHQVRGLGIQTMGKHRKGMITPGFLKVEVLGLEGDQGQKGTVLFTFPVTNDM